MALFVLALLLPIQMRVATLLVNPTRLYLLIMGLPFAISLFSGKLGRLTWVDFCILLHGLMIVVILLIHHGMQMLGYGLSQFIEIVGGYLAARVLIRSLADYERMIRYILIGFLVLLPFSIDEMLHFRMVISDTLRHFFAVLEVMDMNLYGRFGMRRVQSVFPHPILYGLFCSLPVGSAFYLYRTPFLRRVTHTGLPILMTFTSLSSAPMLSVILQLGLIAWGKVTRGSWWLLVGIIVTIFAVLQIFTNRGAFVLFVEKLTLDPSTGWARILIWQYGSQNVVKHPFLGIGMNDWERPWWMLPSVDNFWLLTAMRYGLPGFLVVFAGFLFHLAYIARAKNLSEDVRMLRVGYMVTICALIFMLTTVHVWDSVQVFVFFLLGAGAFFYTSDPDMTPAPSDTAVPLPSRAGPQFTRFPQKLGRNSPPHPAEMRRSSPASGTSSR